MIHVAITKLGQEGGWPGRRKRTLAWGFKKLRLIWLGPQDDDSIMHDLHAYIRHYVVLDGDVFVGCEVPDAHDKHLNDLCGKRGFYPRPGKLKMEDLFPPGPSRNRYHGYVEEYEKGTRCGPAWGLYH